MAKNIEFKCRVDSLDDFREAAAKISDGPPVLLVQEDTFFATGLGRLKLRKFSETEGQLIYYSRPDVRGPKLSDYQVLSTGSPSEMISLLGRALGIRGIVRKHRWLFLSGSNRIHLDEVEELGSFIEVEVVLAEGQTPENGVQIAQSLMDDLGISDGDLVSQAYIDLLEVRDEGNRDISGAR